MSLDNEQARRWFSQVDATYSKRSEDYNIAEVVGGYSTAGPISKLAHMVIRFHSDSEGLEELDYRYKNFTAFRKLLSPAEGFDLFCRLANEETVKIGNLREMSFGPCTLNESVRWDSNTYPAYEKWPVEVGLLTAASDGRLIHELLASSDGPLFTGPQQAIDEITHIPTSWRGYSPTIYCIMPDRRCRLSELQITSNSVSGAIERGPTLKRSVILKGYASRLTPQIASDRSVARLNPPVRFEVTEPKDSFSLETGFFAEHLIITILERDSNEILDRREFESGRMVLAGDVKTRADESYLKDLIRGGESENVEFKVELRSSNNWIRTVCAFSNGKGGLIFFGVDDSGTVIGLKSDTGADWVTQKIESLMEPFPDYLYVIDNVDEKKIAYLRVQSGAEKPYLVKGQGVFVRSQATTRKATRHELLAISKGESRE